MDSLGLISPPGLQPAVPQSAVLPTLSAVEAKDDQFSELNLMVQRKQLQSLPSYQFEKTGAEHDPTFTCTCTVLLNPLWVGGGAETVPQQQQQQQQQLRAVAVERTGSGTAKTKQDAKAAAAQSALAAVNTLLRLPPSSPQPPSLSSSAAGPPASSPSATSPCQYLEPPSANRLLTQQPSTPLSKSPISELQELSQRGRLQAEPVYSDVSGPVGGPFACTCTVLLLAAYPLGVGQEGRQSEAQRIQRSGSGGTKKDAKTAAAKAVLDWLMLPQLQQLQSIASSAGPAGPAGPTGSTGSTGSIGGGILVDQQIPAILPATLPKPAVEAADLRLLPDLLSDLLHPLKAAAAEAATTPPVSARVPLPPSLLAAAVTVEEAWPFHQQPALPPLPQGLLSRACASRSPGSAGSAVAGSATSPPAVHTPQPPATPCDSGQRSSGHTAPDLPHTGSPDLLLDPGSPDLPQLGVTDPPHPSAPADLPSPGAQDLQPKLAVSFFH